MSDLSSCCQVVDDGIKLEVRLQPNARKAQVGKIIDDEDGTSFLKIRVTEVPENGKANSGLIKLLAKSLKIPKSSIEIIKGHKDRRKTLLLKGSSHALHYELDNIVRP